MVSFSTALGTWCNSARLWVDGVCFCKASATSGVDFCKASGTRCVSARLWVYSVFQQGSRYMVRVSARLLVCSVFLQGFGYIV